MNINATLFGQVVIALAVVMAILGYYLGKRKTQTPILTAVVAFFTALVPPVALLFLVVLVLKNDVQPNTSN
jgi:RsiW-degrading membrane proteinase PrsW (M82 family)